MHRPSPTLTLTIAAAVLFCGLVTLRAQNASKPRPVSIAVVDLEKVINGLSERASVQADFTRKQESLQQEELKRRDEVKKLQEDLQQLSQDSEAYKQTEAKAERKVIELDSWAKWERTKLEREAAIGMESLYARVTDAVRHKAERDGYDLVLVKDPTDSVRARSAGELRQQIALRKVLYSVPEIDLTDQVLQALNNDFNNRPGKVEAPAPKTAAPKTGTKSK